MRGSAHMEIVGKGNAFKLDIGGVQMGKRKDVRPEAKERRLCIGNNNLRDVIIFRAEQGVMGGKGVFQIANKRFGLESEGKMPAFPHQRGRCQVE